MSRLYSESEHRLPGTKWLRHRGYSVRRLLGKAGSTWQLEDGSILHDGSGGTLLHSLTGFQPPPAECFYNIAPSHGFETPLQASLDRRIHAYVPPQYSFTWAASGSDALELAIWLLSRPDGEQRRVRFFVAEGSYHGATQLLRQLSTRSAFIQSTLGAEVDREIIPSFDGAESAGHQACLEQWLSARGVGPADILILETVPTTGAVFSVDTASLAGLIRFCRERGATVLLDEVACGAFRHGWFSSLSRGLTPDGVVVSKGLACGTVACSALFVRQDFVERLQVLGAAIPGYTVTVNDVAASLVLQALDCYEQLASAGWFEQRAFELRELVMDMSRSAPQFHYEATATTLRISSPDRERFDGLIAALERAKVHLYSSSSVITGVRRFFALYCPAFDQSPSALHRLDRLTADVVRECGA